MSVRLAEKIAMRILQVHNHHAGFGGAMEVVAHEAQLLQQAGHDVDEYTIPPAEELSIPRLHAGAKAIWNRSAQAEMRSLIQRSRPDVIHVHTPFPLLSPSVLRVGAPLGIPTVMTLHSFRLSCIAATCTRDGRICEDCVGKVLKVPGVVHRCYHDSALGSTALTLGLVVHRRAGTFARSVSRYLALTPFARQLLIRDGFPADRIIVKPNSVPDSGELAGVRRDNSDCTVLFAGRLLEIKGVRTLLDALVETIRRHEARDRRRWSAAGDGGSGRID